MRREMRYYRKASPDSFRLTLGSSLDNPTVCYTFG